MVVLSSIACGCASHLEPTASIEPKIEFMRGEYKICRESCPVKTPKELDDEQPFEAQIHPFEPLHANKDLDLAQAQQASNAANQSVVKSTSILFDFGKSKPNKSGLKALSVFAQTDETSQIELVGGTDDIGTKNFNNNLATKRAKFVKAWLLSHGVSASITIVTEAECCHPTPYDKTAETLKAKRRVSIVLR
jgi:outer membrane protein OmpA-like peptidoglycan-associated protein